MLSNLDAAVDALNEGKNVYFVPLPVNEAEISEEENPNSIDVMLLNINPSFVEPKYFTDLNEAKIYAEGHDIFNFKNFTKVWS